MEKSVDNNSDNIVSLVVKSNAFVLAHFKMTTHEQKIVLLCISKLKKSNKIKNTVLSFKLTAKEISEFLNLLPDSIYKQLDNISNNLMSYTFEIKNDKLREFEKMKPFPYSSYSDGIFTLDFNSHMEKYLLELKDKFTAYNIKNIRDLKSNYSIRIYEILKSYEWKNEVIFELEELKKMSGIMAFDKSINKWIDLYPRYYDFKKRVLLVSQKELSEKTDIAFDFEEIKTGRRITKIKFIIQGNPPEQDKTNNLEQKSNNEFYQPPANELDEDELMDALRSFILEPIKIKDLRIILKTANNDVQLVKEKYELAQKQNKIENLTAWLISAIENDFSEPVGKKKKNKFINYEQGDWDFEKLEKLEKEYIDKKLSE